MYQKTSEMEDPFNQQLDNQKKIIEELRSYIKDTTTSRATSSVGTHNIGSKIV